MTDIHPPSPLAARRSVISARNRTVIALLIASAFVVILNETIMGVALPALEDDLGITTATGQWLTTGFLLTMAVVIPTTGYLIQRLPTRSLFLMAMSLFTTGTLICAAAPGFELLLTGRIVQATGTAIMMPLLMTTIMTVVPPEHRGRTVGTMSIVISVAPALGPTVSGAILATLEWRWIFIVMLPLALASLILGAVWMRNVTDTRHGRIDVLSVILSAVAFGGLIYGLSSVGEAAAHANTVAVPPGVPIIVGAVALAAFVFRQLRLQRSDRALLDLRVFTSRNFTMSLIMLLIGMMALFGTLIVLPLYLQQLLRLNPLAAGLLLLPGGIMMATLSPIVGRLYDRFGPRALLVGGSFLLSAALWAMTFLTETTSPWVIPLVHTALSAGLALLFTPLYAAALGSVPSRLYSHASAIVNTLQQVAAGAGTAMFVTALTVGAATAAALHGGDTLIADSAAGMRTAFQCGGIVALFTIPFAFTIQEPSDTAPAYGGH